MKRTAAAFALLIGLTALMIGLYLNEFGPLGELLRGYSIPFP